MIAAIPLIGTALSLLSSSGATNAAASGATTAAAGSDFGAQMAKLSNDAINNVKKAESISVDGIEGKANVQSVVDAVMTAQESLQTALAIRDKSVAAFQEITRMAI